jgi:ABC-type transport system involved in cytochrome c biogenesis permease component
MKEKQDNNTKPIEITKARSRVTTNTPAVYWCCFWMNSLMRFSRVFRSASVLVSS